MPKAAPTGASPIPQLGFVTISKTSHVSAEPSDRLDRRLRLVADVCLADLRGGACRRLGPPERRRAGAAGPLQAWPLQRSPGGQAGRSLDSDLRGLFGKVLIPWCTVSTQ